ncbi:MAG: hypothetical protein P3W94_008965 [Paracoccus sp. (in: a-proteobacteria)]|nr:hypothetical protein [Paracoccus sp. (in: a-proteobacteria)]
MHVAQAELTPLRQNDDSAVIILTGDEIDHVSGALLPFAIPAAVKAGAWIAGSAAAGAGVGYGIGYWANRD